MNSDDLNKVWKIKTLKGRPKEEEARKILENIAKQVQPIMRKHNWQVKLLSELCPKKYPKLLGFNNDAGIHIQLCLRSLNRDAEFLHFDDILDTMLHELCHNAHEPHNSSFYQLWNKLRKEYVDLVCKEISGTAEGFDLPGRRSSSPLYIEDEVEEKLNSLGSQTGLHDGTQMTENSSMWECSKCTFLNPPPTPICDICSTQKPEDVDTEYNSWLCKFCTLDNDVKLDSCGGCGNWRFPIGAPVATY